MCTVYVMCVVNKVDDLSSHIYIFARTSIAVMILICSFGIHANKGVSFYKTVRREIGREDLYIFYS